MSSYSNEDIALELRKLAATRLINKQKYEAYVKASKAVEIYPVLISSSDQIEHLSGIDHKIASEIDVIIEKLKG